MTQAASTPMMKQYHAAKAEYPDCILFFRMGDFFEMFFDDAVQVSKELGLTLTSRSKGEDAVPMAGVPVKSYEGYLRKLVAHGHRVAICDQVEDARKAKDLVDRRVVRVVTPGTLTEDSVLDDSEPNFLAAVAPGKRALGLAWADLSTGTFELEDVAAERLTDELIRLAPAELLLPEELHRNGALKSTLGVLSLKRVTPLADWQFGADGGRRVLADHFRVSDLAGFGVEDLGPALGAGGALLQYLKDTQLADLSHIASVARYRHGDAMFLDQATRRALELTANTRDGGRDGTLLQVLNRTVTPMGARRLKAWVTAPLKRLEPIRERQAGVQCLVEGEGLREGLRSALDGVHDLERLTGRLGCGRANARDLVALRRSLDPVAGLVDRLETPGKSSRFLAAVHDGLDPCPEVTELVGRAVVDEPPAVLNEAGIIRDGYHAELDELRTIGVEGKGFLDRYRTEEAERTGIPNLKVGFNRVFGFYLEVTNAHAGRVPENYVRKQTLKNAERYITPELKEYEARVLNAEERIKELEYQLFMEVRGEVERHVARIQGTANALADLDAAASLAEVAVRRRYVRPEINSGRRLEVEGGRHPVLEAHLASGEFVPNDLALDGGGDRLIILTGPNMSGKSTYIRQAALHVLMAQAGSYVPAERAVVGLVDRVFTRVGASDDLSRGRSTFMVEMTEVANILNNATDRSLLVLDEVGRGTSTYDGVSIAWAVAEHLHGGVKARTLFATHYHELTDLANRLEGVSNYNVTVREWGDEVVFLHRIAPGGCDRSYGLHVARLAGVPDEVIERARLILDALQGKAERREPPPPSEPTSSSSGRQLSLFGLDDDPVIAALREADFDAMSPIEAMNFLWKLKEQAK
jgi:DNA mismatch repair protein MutS